MLFPLQLVCRAVRRLRLKQPTSSNTVTDALVSRRFVASFGDAFSHMRKGAVQRLS